ncbi:MAG: methionine ABC transporter ATP-binding protein [Clostridioides sp.]|jgi:D-methionine transport system ATP-binding protein|nr:methionine ABC transporter ATP-binding protein [Clostridioides sp.]
MIKIKNLKKTYGDLEVLSDVSLEIKKGEIYGLVGRSGEGKSTLLRCINGLVHYDSGSLTVDGEELKLISEKDIRSFRKNIGMIFQQFALLERKSVYENIALPLRAWKYDKNYIDKRVKELLDLVGILDKADQKPKNLSGGQKQRVGIARALSMNPKILLCDEATSALDPKTTKDILKLLKNINKTLGLTMVVVTHEMSVVKDICDRVSVLSKGKIAVTDTVENLFLKQHKYLEDLIGEEDLYLPDDGKNIKVILPSCKASSTIISSIAKSLSVEFKIVDADINKYQSSLMGTMVLNVKDKDLSRIESFLRENDIEFVSL